jgi:predicted dehydrogenase
MRSKLFWTQLKIMDKLRWGLIGCGDISRKRIAPALKTLKQCELIAVARANHALAESFAQEFNAKRWYKNWHDLIRDEEIDAVYIATPVYLHAEQTMAAAREGKHVLCEKPMALNGKDCDNMIETCHKNNVRLGVAYYRHFYPVITRVKEIILSGEIGDPVIAEIHAYEWFDRRPGEPRYWLLQKELSGGGPMMDFGCHRIEVLQNLFGEVKEMQSQLLNVHFKRDVEDTAYVSLLFENNTHTTIGVTNAAFEIRDTLDIYGTKGTINIPVLNNGVLIVKTEKGERLENHPPLQNIHQPLIEDFTNAVMENRNPLVDGSVGRKVSLILDNIYK